MKCSVAVINRIKRAQGQMNGVLKMIDENRGCDELTVQLKAILNSIKKTITLLTVENLSNNVKDKYDIDLNDFKNEINLILNR
ncbi:MAG: metal-sensing transcriptional repressor [Acholeplasmataceae bacterium]